MPADVATRKKRTTTESTPAPEGDHRKRRRNRTTQSCLNCHASKRMCDRKRPACQRCTTLGLSGLCVYEVDDPNQRDNHQDEKITLRNRVAELEGVIREMKNKPHPRWIQKMTIGEDGSNKWQPRERTGSVSSTSQTSDMPSNESTSDIASPRPTPATECPDPLLTALRLQVPSGPDIRLSVTSATPIPTTPCSDAAESPTLLRPPPFRRALSTSSPDSTPCSSFPSSPNPGSSPSPRPPLQIEIAGPDGDSSLFDMSSLLETTSFETSGFEDGVYGHILDQIMRSDHAKNNTLPFEGHCGGHLLPAEAPTLPHCGCLETQTAYSAVLELSIRLRRAAEMLGRVNHHAQGSDCGVYSKVAELDTLASNTLNCTPTPLEHANAFGGSPYTNGPTSTLTNAYHRLQAPHNPIVPHATITPQSLHYLNTWDQNARLQVPPGALEDSLMSWDGTHQLDWSPSA